MLLERESYPHWEKPYNKYFYKVYNIYGGTQTFCHIDIAVNYYNNFGTRIYIQTKDLNPIAVLWKYKE